MVTIPRSSLISLSFHLLQIQLITSPKGILCSEKGKRKKYLVVTERPGKWRMDWEIWERGGPPQCLMWYRILSEDVSIASTLSYRRSLPYGNQSNDLIIKSMDWFLHDRDLHHEIDKFSSIGITRYEEYLYR